MILPRPRVERRVSLELRQGSRLVELPEPAPGCVREFKLVVEGLDAAYRLQLKRVDSGLRSLRVLVYHPTERPRNWTPAIAAARSIFGVA